MFLNVKCKLEFIKFHFALTSFFVLPMVKQFLNNRTEFGNKKVGLNEILYLFNSFNV